MSESLSQEEIEKVVSQGYLEIKEGDFEEALKTSQRLERECHSAAFEIGALAHAGLENTEAAIKLLRKGVQLAPGVWVNWQLLGNMLSDEGDFEAAEDSFRDALRCEDPWIDSIRLNQAILKARIGKYEEALIELAQIEDEDLQFEVAAARVNTLSHLDLKAEALQVAQSVLKGKALTASDEDAWFYIAVLELRLRFEAGLDPEEVRKEALALLRADSDNDEALALIRDTRGERSRDCRYLRLVLNGNNSEEAEGFVNFYVAYDVVAESSEDALSYVEEIEALNGFDLLEVENCEVLAKRTKDPKGVYRIGVRHAYAD